MTTAPMPSTKVQRIMTQPIVRALHQCLAGRAALPCCAAALRRACQNLIFRFLQSKQRISVWLYENTEMRIEGRIIGFDEYMNIVLDDAEEVLLNKKTRKAVGASHCSIGSPAPPRLPHRR